MVSRPRFWFRFTVSSSFVASAILLAAAVPTAHAACPGTAASATGMAASRFIAASPGTATLAFAGTGSMDCTGMVSGAATQCVFDNNQPTGSVIFIARWASEAARTGDATGGCKFTCPGGMCFVKNDALPVELMQFGVE